MPVRSERDMNHSPHSHRAVPMRLIKNVVSMSVGGDAIQPWLSSTLAECDVSPVLAIRHGYLRPGEAANQLEQVALVAGGGTDDALAPGCSRRFSKALGLEYGRRLELVQRADAWSVALE